MKSYNIVYENDAFSKLPLAKINASKSILIQIFSGIFEKSVLEDLLSVVQSTFPKAQIIGTSSAGEIVESKITDGKIVLSITTFDNTTLKVMHLKDITPQNSFQNGLKLAENILTPKTKAMILFADVMTCNGNNLLQGIHSISKDITISGGIAGIEPATKSTLLLSKEGISKSGAVCVALDSDTLQVSTDYKFDWVPFGKQLTITHAIDNRVYSIDHTSAADIFRHYLGQEVYDALPLSGFSFPLICTKDNMHVSRSVIAKHADGSLEFAGDIQSGERYQIGFGSLESMILNTKAYQDKFMQNSVESLFVYSCVGRKSFMQDEVIKEIKPLSTVANVSGFFTYGEFYTAKENAYFMNHTMTMLSLSEQVSPKITYPQSLPETKHNHFSTLSALSHFLTVSNSELKEYQNYLNIKDVLLCGGPVVNFKIDLEREKRCSYISQNIVKILGYSARDILDNTINLQEIIDPKSMENLKQEFSRYRHNHEVAMEAEIKVYDINSNARYLHLYMALEKNTSHDDQLLIGYFMDITKRVESQKEIQKLAYYDQLTGLANREMLKIKLTEMITTCRNSDRLCGVSFMDLNKFKDVNDTYGHSSGDRLLQLVANRLKTCLREDDFIARIGGDEFIILHGNLKRNTAHTNIYTTLNRATTLIKEPFSIYGKIAHISTSIGTSMYELDGDNIEDLIKHADIAMYQAKNDPNIDFKFYSSAMKEMRIKEVTIQRELKAAIRNQEFVLLYQPQVDTKEGHIVGAEALIRWIHPTKGVISPVIFIPIAEQHHMIVEIGEWIIEEVCHKIKHLQNRDNIPETFQGFSVNISPLQFKDPYFVSKVEKIVTLMQIDTRYLEFELTEGIFNEDIDEMIGKMHQLKNLGITLSLDDFGTGYSSLQYLKKLPIDTVKIDRSFMNNVATDKKDHLLTSTIIELSKNLQYKIVAEGVENIEQLTFLEENDCETYQGFYFSKPIVFEAFEDLLNEKVPVIEAS